MTVDEFLAWESHQPDRYELIGGQPVSVEPSTQAHSLLITDIVSLLRPAVRGIGLRVLINVRVTLGDDIRYPAVVIDDGPFVADATRPSKPVAIIDVDRRRDWSDLPDIRYLSMKIGDDADQVLTLLQMRTK
ncbi:Uma2 family endonuclease [Rhizobium leguminosarum]|uniref:Uma2 family endonuclease n=1 Tax=Rhizobium leguminosarum TaxID=384 RepID=UPI003F9BA29D